MKRIRKRLKKIVPVFALILITGLLLTRLWPDGEELRPEITISIQDAAGHEGATAEVCGPVAAISYREDIDGEPTFLNFDKPHPDQSFTALIRGEQRHRWQPVPEQLYHSEQVLCVTGVIRIFEGDPEIIVTRPDQIRIR